VYDAGNYTIVSLSDYFSNLVLSLKNMWRGVQTGGSGVRDESVRVCIEGKWSTLK
jgi:hypothetical protein